MLLFNVKEIRDTEYYTPEKDEYRLSFGQVVPLVMLLSPFAVIWDHFLGHRRAEKRTLSGEDDESESKPIFPEVVRIRYRPHLERYSLVLNS